MKQNDERQNYKMDYDTACANSKRATITKTSRVTFLDARNQYKKTEVTLQAGTEVTYLMTVFKCALIKCKETNNQAVKLALNKVNFIEEAQ